MTSTSTPDADLKARHRKMWASGDYPLMVETWLLPLGPRLVEACGIGPGQRVLDVAAGTGNASLPAAATGAEVVASDLTPELLDAGRRRAEAAGLSLEWVTADAERLPFEDGSFDVVMSAIGVMFAPDQERAARELVRVCRPGGVIGVANWTPTGFVGGILKAVSGHVPPPPGVNPPTLWGTEARVRELLGDGVATAEFTTTSVTERFPSAEFFADFFIEHYGPTLKAALALTDDAERTAFRDELVALAEGSSTATDGTAVSDWEYLVTVATKA